VIRTVVDIYLRLLAVFKDAGIILSQFLKWDSINTIVVFLASEAARPNTVTGTRYFILILKFMLYEIS